MVQPGQPSLTSSSQRLRPPAWRHNGIDYVESSGTLKLTPQKSTKRLGFGAWNPPIFFSWLSSRMMFWCFKCGFKQIVYFRTCGRFPFGAKFFRCIQSTTTPKIGRWLNSLKIVLNIIWHQHFFGGAVHLVHDEQNEQCITKFPYQKTSKWAMRWGFSTNHLRFNNFFSVQRFPRS